MIILHNQYDKKSRDFVELYGEGNIVLDYPTCVEEYTEVSGFPSVVMEMPQKIIEEFTIPAYTNSETGETYDAVFVPTEIIEAHIEIYAYPETMEEVFQYIENYINYDPGKDYR